MNLIRFIGAIIFAIGGLFSITCYLNMLQQNSYFISRYFKWLCDAGKKSLIFKLFLFVLNCVLLILNLDVVILIISVVYLLCCIAVALVKQKNAIKPLVFTARIKRMYFNYIIVCALLILASVYFDYVYTALYFVSVVCSVYAMVIIALNSPIEKSISRWYICDAKKILKSNKNIKVIGITGSYGKTSTKYILARILQEKYNVLYTPGSFNTTLGVVRTIREMLKPIHEVFICEMGAKNVGDIKEICDIVSPDCGLITSVGPQHLETFKSIDNVLKTKFELADAIKANNGTVYLNVDNEYINSASNNYNYVGYSFKNGDLTVSNLKCSRFGTEFDVRYKDEEIHLSTNLLGRHNVLNIAGAVAIAVDLGISARQIKYAVDRLTPIQHRLELKPFVKGSLLIDDAYNSNPSGANEALNVLDSFEGFRKILITPGMVELGSAEYDENYKFGKSAAEKDFDIILVGKQRSKPIADGIKSVKQYDVNKMCVVASFKEAMAQLNKFVDNNCVVLIENDLPDNYLK